MGISSGRIIDNAGTKRLPVGIENFELVVNDFTYVDKSLLVRDLLDSSFNAVLFCRPRRFGKSLAMRMLQCYFEAAVPNARIADRTGLFAGMAINDAGERYARHKGAHPVVFLTLGGAHGATWEDVRAHLAGCMAEEFKRHDYLLGGENIVPVDREKFNRLAAGTSDEVELAGSLAFLSKLLAGHHGAGTVILIDEYDAPVTEGHLNGFRNEAVAFCRSWLTDALKANDALFLGVLTGVQRVSRESVFSGLNNIVVDTPLDHEFTEAFGFTSEEVRELARYLGREDDIAEMADWYDGYRFGQDDVYNPWSLLNYLAKGGVAQPYWGNTSSNAVVRDLFEQAEGATAAELEALAAGETVTEPIDLATVYDLVGIDPQAIWSQLYLAGYLTTDDVDFPNDSMLERRLRVPNREVRLLFRKEFADRSATIAGGRHRLRALHDALQNADALELETALRGILLESPSALDLVRENSYHMFMLGLLYQVYGYRFPVSNREAGEGRADVLLVPERENEGRLPGIVVEVKWGRDLDQGALSALAAEAIAQIESRDYAQALPTGPVLKWGVAFSGKQCAAACVRG